ncbi:MAG: CheA signal transduction histidine kinase [Candidatus Solibacter sp.]|nr:CheA signal transduction histidine kinase [Candidatus Solibacter sp.]
MSSGELRREVEDLALRLVVGDPDGESAMAWVPALEKLRERAQREQAPAVSAAATGLMENLRDNALPEAALQEGIAALQKALDAVMAPASSDRFPAQDPELISDFIVESREHLANIENQVLTLEREPTNSESLNAVFRGFHTIKGLAGFLELWEVQKLSHEVETVLDRARNSQWTINGSGIDVILECADYLRGWLAHLESVLQQRASEPPPRDESLLSRIVLLCSEPDTGAPGLANMAAAVAPAPAPPAALLPIPAPRPPAPEPATALSPAAQNGHRETMAVKVDTAKLDYLVDMAGEMVIAESLVRHDEELAGIKNPLLHRKIAHMTRITAELQKTAMAMRLVPMGPLFRRMARLVRDLSRQFGKQVEMETQGDDIELDRTIVEELADPLMHMVRNALDHGIEFPHEREAAGKPAAARLILKAQHRAGQVVIEITDDGRGLNRTRILERAVLKGLVHATDTLTDNEVYNLIFEPGFTTAAQVTNVSGRGVGMDVVRRHIEKLRGRIEIRSTLGQGASFLLKLPLTLAIIEGLVVSVGVERYIVPLFAVREMFRPTSETIWTVQQRAEMALVRGMLLPVVRLYRVFGVEPAHEDPCRGVLVVAEVDGHQFCLLVDALIGKQEVVIKSLGDTFKNVSGVAGGAILGDGRVGLILDLDRLAKDKNSEPAR